MIAGEFSDFANLSSRKVSAVDLKKLLQKSVELFHSNTAIQFIYHVSPSGAFQVTANRDQLSGVFINLLKNAVQSLSGKQNGTIEVDLHTENNFHIVRIKDNGSGMSEEIQQKIFVPNFTTKSSGMGLGLAIVKKVLDDLDAEITFITDAGNGTTFTLKFPVA